MKNEHVKILVAEDTSDLLEIVVDGLRHEGFQVVPAKDGEEAWEKIKTENPDVILLDLMMPKMDGWEVLKELRANPPTKKWQPVIIVSALQELEDMKKGFAFEADHYITKPWQMNDILKAIQSMLRLIPRRRAHGDHEGIEEG